MKPAFTAAEKKKWRLQKHLKDHGFEYVLDMVLTMLFAYILLKLCRAEYILPGMALSFAWALGRAVQQVCQYKKDYVDPMD